MAKSKRFAVILLASIFFLLLSVVLSLCLGSVNITPYELVKIVIGRETGVKANIFWYSRLVRTLSSMLSGVALAVSGAVIQKVLANKLASPSIIGVNAGAGFGVTLCCAFGVISGWMISAAAFAGSLAAVLIISFFSYRTGASKTTVILSGVALNSIFNAFCEAISVLDTDVNMMTLDFRVGGFSSVSYTRLTPAAILILISLFVLFTLSNELDVLSLGDESALGVGLSVKKYRFVFLFLAALLSGAAVSFSGLLGFIGLIVPHFVRKLAGGESRRLIPMCAVIGGAFVTFCDLAARMLFIPYELPVGIIMSLVGGPAFVFLLIRLKGGRRSV